MSTQKALLLLEKQGSYAVRDIDIPKPGPGELLVEIKATGLNPVDWKIQAFGLFAEQYPAIIGLDATGTVEAIGSAVTAFKKGDGVIYQGILYNDRATYQQYTLIDAGLVAKVRRHVMAPNVRTNLSFLLYNSFLTVYHSMAAHRSRLP